MPEHAEEIYCRLAKFAVREGIRCYPLSGIDPETGAIGRDLDLWVYSREAGARLMEFFGRESRSGGYRWVVSMNPIWGPRCIAVDGDDFHYVELHLIERVSTRALVPGPVDPDQCIAGALGFRYSPWLMFFKQVLVRQFDAMIANRPIWSDAGATREYFRDHRDSIERHLGLYRRVQPQFMSALLADDDSPDAARRRIGLLGFAVFQAVRYPLASVGALARSLARKLLMYWAPCVPVVEVLGVPDAVDLRADLAGLLGGIFPVISVVDEPPNWAQRRRHQARQHLLVFAPRGAEAFASWADVRIRWDEKTDNRLVRLCHAVMDGVADMNSKWLDRSLG